ncbi:integrase, catalytic region, zinc finger, CCHC-type containing protein [Tanacetum coccineum]
MNRDSHVKNSILANSKKPTKKVAVYLRKNKQTNITSENVISNKGNVIDVDVVNAPKAKTLLCVSFHKTRFSKESTLSKSSDTTYVVSKPKIDVKSTSKANDKVVQIVLWIVDSGCSKHMTGDQSLLKNFIEKFMGTVRFGNDNFAAITGYGDYIQGNITICHVYYVEGLGHNLFCVGQFFDGDLEVAFRSKTCYVRNLEGDDLLTGGRESNLYTISISDMVASSPVCLMSKATSTKSWLWHRRLLHLNFGTINDLTGLDLVDGLPKDEQTSSISLTEADEFNQEDSANFDGNSQFSQVTTSINICTKDHPLDQVIGDPSKPVMTRQRLHTDSEVCMYALTVSTIEPKNIKEAMADHSWIESMQDELNQFESLQVWELVPRPEGKNIIALKWL